MSDVDDFVFQYLLTLNRSYWQFRHQPRNAQIEQEIIKLGQKEYAIEHDHKFQEIMRHTLRPFTNSVWKQLDLGELRDELRRFSIVSPEILEKFPDVDSADISLEIQLIPKPVDRFNVYEHLYFFSEDGATYYWGVLYRKQKNSKLVIPFCSGTKTYPFWPEKIQPIFYNTQFVEKAHAVILTDDIACAEFYQTQLLRSGNFDLAWLSWYGDLKLYPWEQLKDKQVYFFMEQHSELSYKQMLETASEVQEQLRAVGGPKLSLIFMNSNEFLGAWASPYKENIPMIINLEEWKNRTANLRIQGSDSFDCFKHKVAPRPNLPVLLNLTPFAHFIVHGNRILVTGPGNRKEIFLLALLTPFCSYTLMPVSSKGTVLFVRHDQSYFHDWAATLQGNHGLNVSDLNQWQLSNNISGPYPLLLDMPLNISTLDPKSTSDCQHLLTLIEQAVWRQNTEGSKVLVLDSLSQFLVKVLNSTLLFLENLYNNGWTVFFVESRRTPYLKAFHCDQVIVVEPSPVCTGNEVVCSTETLIHGKIKKFYSINLVDRNQPILKESSYNRKPAGLLRPRWQLEKELIRLFCAGAKGKEIAERLQISESMVKKLKREYGLSKPRSRPDLNPSGNNYYGPNFMHPKPK